MLPPRLAPARRPFPLRWYGPNAFENLENRGARIRVPAARAGRADLIRRRDSTLCQELSDRSTVH